MFETTTAPVLGHFPCSQDTKPSLEVARPWLFALVEVSVNRLKSRSKTILHMVSVPDSTSTSNEVQSSTTMVHVSDDTLTVDSSTPGSAVQANGVQVSIPERLRQEAIDEVARRLSLREVPQEPVTGTNQLVTSNQAKQQPVSQLQTQNHAMRAHAHGSLDAAGSGTAIASAPTCHSPATLM